MEVGGGAVGDGGAGGTGSEVARRQSLEVLGAGLGGTQPQGRRKRARGDVEEEEEEVRAESTRDLVKRLRRELEEKDERIRMLNMVVQRLVTQQPQHGQMQHQRGGC